MTVRRARSCGACSMRRSPRRIPQIMPRHLPAPPRGRTIVVGAGKASAAMARAFEDHWPGDLSGLVVTRYGHAAPCKRVEIVEAAHPVPDAKGEGAARRILEMVGGLSEDDLVVALISGGGSALLSLPAEGLSLADKQAVNRALLASGASIEEMNCVRKHLSAIKGGRLAAAAWPARVVTLLISDVPGDDPAIVASGPTVADPTNFAEARAILPKYGISPPPSVAAHLVAQRDETPKPGDPRLARAETHLIARPQGSLTAAAAVAEAAGVAPLILGNSIEGESREVAKVFAGIAQQVRRYGQPCRAPCVLLSGGETTVTLRGAGRGGATSSFCSPWRSRSAVSQKPGPSPGTPMASTGPRRSPARSSPPTPFLARRAWVSAPRIGWRTTTRTLFSRRSATRSSPARR